MGNGAKRLSVKASKHGYFGEYGIGGLWYQDCQGRHAWHITANHHNISGKLKHYWVEGQEFYAVAVNAAFDGSNEHFLRTSDLVGAIDTDEKQAILDAIAKWEAPALAHV
jgi:hypothetical protein